MVERDPATRKMELDGAMANQDPPFAVIDLDAFDRNRHQLTRRSTHTPIRVASKSLRCRWALDEILSHDGFHGILAFTLPEAMWLASETEAHRGISDVVVGYPSVDRGAFARLHADSLLRERVTVMIDDLAQLEIAQGATTANPLRVCIDVDSSWRPSRLKQLHVGVRRSPLHEAPEVLRLAEAIARSPGLRLVGLMFYEAQIAGLGDRPKGHPIRGRIIAAMQAKSRQELVQRRPMITESVNALLSACGEPSLEFVNAGGTGSLEYSSADPSVTEVTAGSGFYGPTLFDTYSHFTPESAAMFGLPVVRRPSSGWITVLGGGYVASGPADSSRLPTPVLPAGLRLDGQEGAGEVQTPLSGETADEVAIGETVWFRHAKAGELAERFNEFHLVRGGEHVGTANTYRGDGYAFL